MIILVCGYINSGKDEFADYLVKNYKYKKYAFADILKEMASEEYKIPLKNYYSRELKDEIYKETNKTPRETCLIIGKRMREKSKDYWVNKLIERIKGEDGDKVISDCRFPNEIKRIKEIESKTKVVWIDRYDKSILNDESETSINKESEEIDEIIENRREIESYYEEIKEFICKFKKIKE